MSKDHWTRPRATSAPHGRESRPRCHVYTPHRPMVCQVRHRTRRRRSPPAAASHRRPVRRGRSRIRRIVRRHVDRLHRRDRAGVGDAAILEGIDTEQLDAVDHHQAGDGRGQEHDPDRVELRCLQHLARLEPRCAQRTGLCGRLGAPAGRTVILGRVDHHDAAQQDQRGEHDAVNYEHALHRREAEDLGVVEQSAEPGAGQLDPDGGAEAETGDRKARDQELPDVPLTRSPHVVGGSAALPLPPPSPAPDGMRLVRRIRAPRSSPAKRRMATTAR